MIAIAKARVEVKKIGLTALPNETITKTTRYLRADGHNTTIDLACLALSSRRMYFIVLCKEGVARVNDILLGSQGATRLKLPFKMPLQELMKRLIW